MEIYIITLLILLLFSFLELRVEITETQHKTMSVFIYFIFVLQVGLRWQTGTDWDNYLMHFNEINNISDVFLTLTGFDLGYSFFVLIVKFFSNSYTVFLLIHALIYYFLIFSAFKKLSPFLFISLMVFYATNLGVLGSNRQLLALGICMYSLKYILDGNTLKFFLFIGIAFLFHSTALIFIVFLFLNRDIKQYLIIVILIASFIIGKTNFPFLIFSFVGDHIGGMGSSKVFHYLDIHKEELLDKNLSLIGLFKRLIFIGLFLFNYNFLSSKLPYYKLIFNGYFVGLIFYSLFSSSLLIMVNRGSLYFNIMETLLLACQFLVLKNKVYQVSSLVVLSVVSVFLLFQSISGYADLFIPYKGIFINTDFLRFRID